ncbi:pentapeptide repeat-containing protein, partial [Pseudomonas aeruginosa]|nr:pentapeptide repeat-containing protein [Pseudomonas aeruginosa]
SAALMNASFVDAIMKGVKLVDAMAAYADFSGADLSMASLKNADIGGSNFINSNLRDVNIDVARIDGAVFRGAIYNDRTIWPKGFIPENFGAIKG